MAPLAGLTAVLPGEPVVVLVAVHHVSPGHLVTNQLQREDSLRNCLGNGTFQTSKVFIDFDFNVFF